MLGVVQVVLGSYNSTCCGFESTAVGGRLLKNLTIQELSIAIHDRNLQDLPGASCHGRTRENNLKMVISNWYDRSTYSYHLLLQNPWPRTPP